MKAAIVVDLGFGDAGKGLITDYLTRAWDAEAVVRFNGGAQAGHNVIAPDGAHHTFSQFGAGTFVPGVRTFLSRSFVLHPTALLVEAEILEKKGIERPLERVSISPDALVITPLHQAAGRLREMVQRHGSCGIGFGETVQDQHWPDAIRARDLLDWQRLLRLLNRLRERKSAEQFDVDVNDPAVRQELSVFTNPQIDLIWADKAHALMKQVTVQDDERFGASLRRPVVFEGAQGVLLDEWHGFHPHTTWSTCTFDNATSLLNEWRIDWTRIGVLRSYAVRHGAGPFPTFDQKLTDTLSEKHNAHGPWQGRFLAGFFDPLLARYALNVCGGADRIALTHLDVLPKVSRWRVCEGYNVRPELHADDLFRGGATAVFDLKTGPRDLIRQTRLTAALMGAEPIFRDVQPTIEEVTQQLGLRVGWASYGPTAKDVRAL